MTTQFQLGATLSPRQREALEKNAPTADDILNEEIMNELNMEIRDTYDQDLAQELAKADPTLNTVATPEKTEPIMNDTKTLDEELAAIEQKVTTQTTSEVQAATNPEDQLRNRILELMGKADSPPTEGTINAWKAKYGEHGVNAIAFGEGDVYVFAYLNRSQWTKINEVMQKLQEQGSNSDLEQELRFKVIQNAVLWPRPLTIEFMYNSRAGVVDSLYEAIMLQSYFLTPNQVLALTVSL